MPVYLNKQTFRDRFGTSQKVPKRSYRARPFADKVA
jgi:hypothetical protein